MKAKSSGDRTSATPARGSPVPPADIANFKRAVADKVVEPMKKRALSQQDDVARARARHVR
jgi:hypothetical protein